MPLAQDPPRETFIVWKRDDPVQCLEFECSNSPELLVAARLIASEKGWAEYEVDFLENYPHPDAT